MSRLRSLRYKIALIFFLVTASAFSVIWFVVVPQLEQNLKERRLNNLVDEAKGTRSGLQLPLGGRQFAPRDYADRISVAEDATDARLTVQDWQRERSRKRNPGFYAVDSPRDVPAFD